MESLKNILAQKKSVLQKGSIPKKVILNEEISKKEEEIRAIEVERAEKLKRKLEILENLENSSNSKKIKNESNSVSEYEKTEPPIPKLDVFTKLREYKQPVTFFGESNWDRYRRLISLTEKKVHQDMKRDDVLISENVKKDKFFALKQTKASQDFDSELLKKFEENDEKFVSESDYFPEFKQKKPPVVDLKVSYEDKCDDIYIWIKNLLSKWGERIEVGVSADEQKIYEECCRYANPLYHLLNQRRLNPEITHFLYYIVHYCHRREYVKANNKYMELAIGNAPWPMGVTMVGIHERSGKQRKKSPHVAYILSDETQRKYLQAIKRFIKMAQQFKPSDEVAQMINYGTTEF